MILLAKVEGILNRTETLFIRSVALLFLVPFLPWERDKFYNHIDLAAYFLYGLLDNIGMTFSIAALGVTSASDAAAIMFNLPLPSAVIAFVLLGEKFNIFDGALLVINSLGIILLCEGSLSRSNDDIEAVSQGLGLLLSFAGLSCFAFAPIPVRFLAHRSNEDPYLVSFNVGCVGIIVSLSSLCLTGDQWAIPRTAHEVLLCVLLSLAAVTNFVSYGKALVTENTMVGTTAVSLCVPLLYLYDIFFNNLLVIWATLLGITLTTGSTLLLTFKTVFQNHDESTEFISRFQDK